MRTANRVTGMLVVADGSGERVPKYGELTVERDGETDTSPIEHDGGFYLEKLTTGRYTARVKDVRGTCTFELEIPAGRRVIQLGVLRCAIQGDNQQP